jgi:hypothetical protein
MSLPQTPETAANRNLPLIIAIVVAAIIGILGITIGAVVLFGQFTNERSNSIPDLLPADTQIYAAMTPNLSDVPNIERLRRAFPEIADYQQQPQTTDQLAELLGVTFADDIAPWIGAEMAVAIRDLPFERDPRSLTDIDDFADAAIMLVLASRDADQARAFLEKQRLYRESRGEQFRETTVDGVTIYAQENGEPSPIRAFAYARDYVVFASDAGQINAFLTIEPGSAETLVANPRYQNVLAALPADRLGYVYIDGEPVGRALQSNAETSLQELEPAGAAQLEQQIANAAALDGIGLSFSVLADGIAFDAIASIDLPTLDPQTRDQLAELSAGVAADRLDRISADTVAALSFRIPAGLRDRVNQAIAAIPDAEDQLAAFERDTDFNLDRDLLSWLQGEATLVLLPGAPFLDETLPATGYIALTPNDRAAAEAGMQRIATTLDLLSNGEIGLREASLANNAWQVVGPPGEVAGGFGFVGDDLVIGLGRSALEAAAAPAQTLSAAGDTYQPARQALPTPNGGMLFINMPAILTLAGDQDALDPETAARLQPLRAAAAAGSPGIDPDGIARGRLFFVVAGE